MTYAVGAKESVTVPAGTFSAWPVTYVVSGETYGYLAAEDVGSVKSDAIELVEIHDLATDARVRPVSGKLSEC